MFDVYLAGAVSALSVAQLTGTPELEQCHH